MCGEISDDVENEETLSVQIHASSKATYSGHETISAVTKVNCQLKSMNPAVVLVPLHREMDFSMVSSNEKHIMKA